MCRFALKWTQCFKDASVQTVYLQNTLTILGGCSARLMPCILPYAGSSSSSPISQEWSTYTHILFFV